MIRSLVIAALICLGACVPADKPRTAEEQAAVHKCIAEGGNTFAPIFDGPFASYTGRVGCLPAATEEERVANVARNEFEQSCEAADGLVWDNDQVRRSCVSSVPDYMQSCSTSADCSGKCMTMYASAQMGFCGPPEPLLGCYTEYGSNGPSEICAEK
jgi:hypothetical protein